MGRYFSKKEDKQELKKGDLVQVTILSKKLYKNDIMISLGFLDAFASQGEKDNFYKPELFNSSVEVDDSTKLVEFHEDDTEKNNTNQSKLDNEFMI
jgi:hypothetical protein